VGLSTSDQRAWSTVQTEAGPITLVPIDSLRARITQLNDWLGQAATNSAALHGQADDGYAAAAALLVPRSGEWSVPQAIAGQVERAGALVDQIAGNDKATGELKDQESHGNVFGRIGAWRQVRGLSGQRAKEVGELRPLLIQIAKAAPPTSIPEAEAGIRSAAEIEQKATDLDGQIAATRESVAVLNAELQRRLESTKAMGFDALYEAAKLATSGPTPVDSPLLVKAGEVAYLSVPATLARMVTRTHFVGGSSGFSFPIGHTGIRYRVGSYSGHPVQQQALSNIDVGSFIVTNQRIAFIGRTKSTSISLTKILHVEYYTDAVAVFQEGRENPDFYKMAAPQRAVFYLNWALNRQAGVGA
jgi:hypothetical protein